MMEKFANPKLNSLSKDTVVDLVQNVLFYLVLLWKLLPTADNAEAKNLYIISVKGIKGGELSSYQLLV